MPDLAMRLYFDRLDADGSTAAPLDARPRVIYVARGSVDVDGETVTADNAQSSLEAVPVRAMTDGAVLWRWEIAPSGAQPELAVGSGVASRLALEAPLTTLPFDEGSQWLLRCDSVSFPPGGCAYTHTHQGPGIRCLQMGTIRIDSDNISHSYGAGEPWFEAGPEPVFAQANDHQPTRFIRVMVLPPALAGKSSIRYINDEDADKPKVQIYHGYGETLFQL